MKKMVVVALAILIASLYIVGCSKSNDNPTNDINCDGVPKNFATDVNPIIQTYCNQPACHNSTSTYGPGPLTNYAEVFAARARIREQIKAGLMPQNASLSTAQRNTIICWIDNNAPNN